MGSRWTQVCVCLSVRLAVSVCAAASRPPCSSRLLPAHPAHNPATALLADLYTLAKAKTVAHSIDVSKDGSKFVTFSADRCGSRRPLLQLACDCCCCHGWRLQDVPLSTSTLFIILKG